MLIKETTCDELKKFLQYNTFKTISVVGRINFFEDYYIIENEFRQERLNYRIEKEDGNIFVLLNDIKFKFCGFSTEDHSIILKDETEKLHQFVNTFD